VQAEVKPPGLAGGPGAAAGLPQPASTVAPSLRAAEPWGGTRALRAAALGALYGVAAACLLAPALDASALRLAVGLLGVTGAAAALRLRSWPALRHPWAAALAAVSGLASLRSVELAFFVLVPLTAAAFASALRRNATGPTRAPAWAAPALFLLAGSLFCVQSLNRHREFASGSMDLGIFVQQHWLLAHGLVPFNTVMGMHMLADHMDWVDYLVAPLVHLGPTPEILLLVQAVVAASAVFPLVALGESLAGGAAGITAAAAFLLAPDVHMGVMFDYNPSVLGSALLLWAAYAIVRRGPVAAVLLTLLACSAKENFTLYVAVLALTLPLLRLSSWRRGLGLAGLALSIFALQMSVLFPAFREGGFRHWEFEELGEGPREIAVAMLRHPLRTTQLMVDQPEKRRSLLLPLLGTGYLGVAEPASLLLLLPNWGERFLSTHRTRWWGYYYGMPAAAMACFAMLAGWRRLRRGGAEGEPLPAYVLACVLLAGIVPPYATPAGNRRSDLYYLRQPEASAPADERSEQALVRYVGRDPRLKVAAQYNLLPHLAERSFIVTLDRAEDADLIALQLDGGTYPTGRPAWKRLLWELDGRGHYYVAFCQGRSVALRRKPGFPVPCPAWDALMRSRPAATGSDRS
jgi:uncharacterized membrane protein